MANRTLQHLQPRWARGIAGANGRAATNATVTLTDIHGNEVARWSMEEGTAVMRQRFPLPLPSGVYLGRIAGTGFAIEFKGEVRK